ncbi:DNA mismatch repair endonuclease MutL [Pelosinus sp. sgz500959]|uniref:DNA mismatch repair endonuclease MutL n=1 Tax=Pelosinus sp. sgz500959 TaxID=3242472 RepID=UPI003670893D
MNIIHVLDENTANKIAAGEVVERPSSIVKELVENSIDAQSQHIEIEISDGGISFIRITDDGSGMSPADAQLSILRHATSKIRLAEDLSTIHSLGFRGEALPSIAAVSKFSLTTRRHDNESLATYVEVAGGITADIREAGGNVGTTIVVKDLFFNTPARKKFLKTAATEASHIHDIIIKLALSYPNIAFKLINNNRLVLSTPGNNELQDTLTSLYGQKIAPDILPIYFENTADCIQISGYLGKPTLLKSNRQWQTFIVNSRVINSRSIAKALDNAYHSLLPKSGYPLAVLNITVSTDTIDVNVHPQKSEIKFSEEQKIFRAVYKAVTDVLSAAHTPTQLAATAQLKTFNTYHYTPDVPSYHSSPKRQEIQYPTTPMPTTIAWQEDPLPLTTARITMEHDSMMFQNPSPVVEMLPNQQTEEQFTLQPLGQVDDCYIISRGHDGLYIIDQHAAHERILYDKMSQHADRIPSQQLLVPLFMDCDATEITIIVDYQETFYKLGFSLDLVGPSTMRISELPSDIPLSEAENSIRQILEFIQNMHNPTAQELRHNCLQIASCRAAIKAGEVLNMRQMQALISELCNTKLPYTCPHGRPAMIRFSPHDLDKMFKRT